MPRFYAVPLADKGFVPISESNRVRWYVEREGQSWPMVAGPFRTVAEADTEAARLNDAEPRQ